MKKAVLILALAGTTYFAQAQKTPMSDKGYWVIESSKQTPKQSVIKFYDLDNKLVYQETITGKKIKINKERTRKALNETLLSALEGKTTSQPMLAMALAK